MRPPHASNVVCYRLTTRADRTLGTRKRAAIAAQIGK